MGGLLRHHYIHAGTYQDANPGRGRGDLADYYPIRIHGRWTAAKDSTMRQRRNGVFKSWVETQLTALKKRIAKLEKIRQEGGLTAEETNRVMAALEDLNRAATTLCRKED
jgi:hypothetical protein